MQEAGKAKFSASPPPSGKRTERDRFVAMAFCWADIVIELDEGQNIVFVGGPTGGLIGHEPEDLVGRPLIDLVAATDRTLVKSLLEVARKQGRIENATIQLNDRNDRARSFGFAGYRLMDFDGHYFFGLHWMPSVGVKGATGHLTRDQESGLYDSGSFAEILTQHLTDTDAPAEDGQLTLIELPDFEAMRQRLNDEEEQRFLNTLGATLRANSLNGDMATRIADDRYGVIHGADLVVRDLELQIAEIARETDPTGEGIEVNSATVDINTSGINEQDLANGLIYTMNQFRSAEAGHFSIRGLSTNLSSLVSEAADSISQFKRMVAERSFGLAFQPIIEVASGSIHHYEALVRFDPTDVNKSPYEYITFAEETGLIPEFDLAMAERVIDWLSHTQLNSDISVAVNVSGHSIGAPHYLEGLKELLKKNAFTRGRLLFEITESARMADLDTANEFIQELRNGGYAVCLDDFGAGAANFQYMSTLEVDIVKLDGSAVRNAQRAPKGKAFLKALVGLCRELLVSTVAEMVDSEESFKFVKECGVEYVQGYLFGRPSLSIADFEQLPSGHLFNRRPEAAIRRLRFRTKVLEG